MHPKLFFAEIAQEGDFPVRIRPRDIGQLIQRKAEDAKPCPAPTRAGKHLAFCARRLPQRANALATAAGPQRDPFDCQLTCRLKVAATGKCHARSISSGVRVTDDAMACGDTLVWPTTKAPAPRSTKTTTTLTILRMM